MVSVILYGKKNFDHLVKKKEVKISALKLKLVKIKWSLFFT